MSRERRRVRTRQWRESTNPTTTGADSCGGLACSSRGSCSTHDRARERLRCARSRRACRGRCSRRGPRFHCGQFTRRSRIKATREWLATPCDQVRRRATRLRLRSVSPGARWSESFRCQRRAQQRRSRPSTRRGRRAPLLWPCPATYAMAAPMSKPLPRESRAPARHPGLADWSISCSRPARTLGCAEPSNGIVYCLVDSSVASACAAVACPLIVAPSSALNSWCREFRSSVTAPNARATTTQSTGNEKARQAATWVLARP